MRAREDGFGRYRRHTRALIVDDHPVFRCGLRTLLQRESNVDFIAEAATAAEAISIAKGTEVDIALVDILLPAVDGITLTYQLLALQPRCKVLGLSVVAELTRMSALLRAGACG